MSLIQVARYSDVKYDFKDGYACVPVLEEAFDQARFAHCALQPGHSITPDVYSVTEHNQLFIFTKGKGYVTTPREAWNVTEPGVFVPEFDTERFTITCSADSKQPLEFLHIITELNGYDKTCLVESRMVLPRFRTISQGWTYDEDFKDNSVTTSMMLLEHRNLGRLSMGCVKGCGPIEVRDVHRRVSRRDQIRSTERDAYLIVHTQQFTVKGNLPWLWSRFQEVLISSTSIPTVCPA